MFREEDYFSSYKKVRNKFRKFRYVDLVGLLLSYMHTPAKDEIEALQRQPWLIMLLIKWLLIDDCYPNIKAKKPTKDDAQRLLQSVFELTGKVRMPTDYEHLSLFFRNIAFQQFLYQIGFYISRLSRQSKIFSELPENHAINKEFRRVTGISIDDFLDLAFAVLVKFLATDDKILAPSWFSTVLSKYPQEKIDIFLGIISADMSAARRRLRESDTGKRPSSELYEQTPFITYPLIRVRDGYLITHKNILFRCIEHFVYDTMRTADSERFMAKFGRLFERYIENSIKYAGSIYVDESELKRILGDTGNQIDFLIQEDRANIFIDAKAVEMSSSGKVTHSAEILRGKTKQSILKAIRQSHDVLKKISETESCPVKSAPNNYLIVVTFKELYVGNGCTYYEAIAKEKMDEIYEEYEGFATIPPENMYFITIDEMDMLCEMVKKGVTSFSSAIEYAKSNDSVVSMRKFDFGQHLRAIDAESGYPKFLLDEVDKVVDRLGEAFEDKE